MRNQFGRHAGFRDDMVSNMDLIKRSVIGLVLTSSALGITSRYVTDDSDNMAPSVFAETSRIEKAAKAEGREIPHTLVLTKANDVTMKFREARNVALRKGKGSHEAFAAALEYKMKEDLLPREQQHPTIARYAAEIPGHAARAMESTFMQSEASAGAARISAQFGRVWSEDHDDVYRTEIYMENVCTTSTDSKGSSSTSCHPELRTRQVYDHTIHTYDYHRGIGLAARQDLSGYLGLYPNADIGETLATARETGADNLYAIGVSMQERFKGKRVSPQEVLGIVNQWATGSAFAEHAPRVGGEHWHLRQLAPLWERAAYTSHYERYPTGSSTDAGPEGYRICKSIAWHAAQMNREYHAFADGIALAGREVPALGALAARYINTVKYKKPGDPDKLREELMERSEKLYDTLIPKGYDGTPFYISPTVVWSLAGAVAGAVAGVGSGLLRRRKIAEQMAYNRI